MRAVPFEIAVGLALLIALPSPAQAPDAAGARGVEYRVDVDTESVFSRMMERDGEQGRYVSLRFRIARLADRSLVTTVPKEDLVVTEEGVPVERLEIKQPRAGQLTVVFAMDISFSMERNNKIAEAKKAALTFLNKLDERADVGLILFDHEIKVAVAPLNDPKQSQADHRRRLAQTIEAAKPVGGTAYLDATVKAVEMLKGIKGRKAVVVMTDGVDTNSTKTLPEAIKAAQVAELPVYTVGIGEPGRNEPVTTVLVLDRSGSMLEKADDADKLSKFEALKRAANRFVALMRPNSKSTVQSFSSQVDPSLPFTGDREVLRGRIDRLKAAGGTLLYDATFAGIETLVAESPPGRKAIVVLTDGRDEAPGSRYSDDEVIARAKEARMPLYMLGLGRENDLNKDVMTKMASATGGAYFHAGTEMKLLELFEDLSIRLHDDGIDEASLKALAEQTGGKYTHVTNIKDLEFIYEKLADELQSTYEVTFRSRRPQHDGTARTIAIKVTRGGQVISEGGETALVARGIVVPQMDYAVYLVFLAGLGGLVLLPAGLRRLYRAAGGGV